MTKDPAKMSKQELRLEVQRLRKQKQVAATALFEVCQNDWGIGHSIARPAHKGIKELAALDEIDD